jgi:hypothetical protein
MSDGYWLGYFITWAVTFIGCWIYAIVAYGFLLGVGLGWLPSAIVATIISFLWPLLVIAVAGIAYFVYKQQ